MSREPLTARQIMLALALALLLRDVILAAIQIGGSR